MKSKIFTEDLIFYYGNKKVLNEISLSILENKITSIMGPSGCGKSTFLRILNRMNDAIPNTKISGKVLLDGENIYATNINPVKIRKRIGMVFQRPNPLPKSIFENVAFGPRISGITDKRKLSEIVEQSLKKAALWDEVKNDLKKSGLALSGGQQQRLCIARTIAIEPEVILMDEPCSSLDPIATSKIEELMQELKKDYTIVIVTHNMQQAARVSDFTAFFLMGEIIEYEETKKLFLSPANKKTEDYITGRFG